MPRNYAKENRWQQGKYRQLLFKCDPALADEYRAHLEKYGMKSIDWFRHAVGLRLVPPEYGAGRAVENADIGNVNTDISINSPDHELPGQVAGYAGPITDISGKNTDISMEITDISIESADIGIADTEERTPGPKKRKKHMPSPPPELVARWRMMRGIGMSYAAIAAKSEGYEVSTVRKNIKREVPGNLTYTADGV